MKAATRDKIKRWARLGRPPMSDDTRRKVKVWAHRSRAIVWAVVGALSFPLGWANSVVLVWVASLYANVSTDWGNGEAADNRELIALLEEIRDGQREILARLPDRQAPPD